MRWRGSAAAPSGCVNSRTDSDGRQKSGYEDVRREEQMLAGWTGVDGERACGCRGSAGGLTGAEGIACVEEGGRGEGVVRYSSREDW